MSNLLSNGDFSAPRLNTNDLKYVKNFTTTQLSQFIWTPTENINGYELLINGTGLSNVIGSNFHYPDATNVSSKNQFISIERSGGIKQTINITQTGIYALSFQYALNQGSNLNNLKILFNGSQVDTVTTSPLNSDWNTTYTNNFTISSTGSLIVLFQGYDDGTDPFIGITNVSLTYVISLSPPTPPNPPISSNIIVNGTFAIPALSNNSFLVSNYYTGSYTLQCWNTPTSASNVVLVNNSTSYTFPTISNQYMVLLGTTSYLNQVLTGSPSGLYNLSFSYATSSKYTSGTLFINIISGNNSTQVASKNYVNTTTTWNTFSCQIPLTSGNVTISFNGANGVSTQGVGITNISMIQQTAITDLSSNILTKSTVYGKFTVQPKYSSYDTSGNPTSNVIVDSGDSTLYGNLIVQLNLPRNFYWKENLILYDYPINLYEMVYGLDIILDLDNESKIEYKNFVPSRDGFFINVDKLNIKNQLFGIKLSLDYEHDENKEEILKEYFRN